MRNSVTQGKKIHVTTVRKIIKQKKNLLIIESKYYSFWGNLLVFLQIQFI